MAIPEPLMSPRITALKQAIEAGDLAALSIFWDEVEQTGTPLIEPIDNDNENAFVTLLWRTDEEIENVIVSGVVEIRMLLNMIPMTVRKNGSLDIL